MFSSLVVREVCAAQVVLNEVVSSNVDGVADVRGEFPDWIELVNSGAVDVDLVGWGLSDDPADPWKFRFPSHVLPAGGHLLVFASGEARGVLNHFESWIQAGDVWRYSGGQGPPARNWAGPTFDDAAWPEGPSGFGYADGDDATIVFANTIYLRRSLTLTQKQLEDLELLYLHVDHDDGFVAYLNGVEVARRNVGHCRRIKHSALATESREARLYRGLILDDAIPLTDATGVLLPGENVVAIQLHNDGAGGDDLSVIPFLTAAMRSVAGSSGPPELLFPSSAFHAPFRISSSGETLVLHDSAGARIDQLDAGRLHAGESRGRHPSGSGALHLFLEPTPGAPNTTPAWLERASSVRIESSEESAGPPYSVTLSAAPGATIHYTLDGSAPDPSDPLYTAPLSIGNAMSIVRARAYEGGKAPGRIATRSFLGEWSVPTGVASLVVDPADLWDPLTGIHVLGSDSCPEYPFYGANFHQHWEREGHLTFFEPGIGPVVSNAVGVRIHGASSRAAPQKSFRLLPRRGYEERSLDHEFFPDTPVDSFRRLILRNGGNDWARTQLRDVLAHELGRGVGLDVIASRPVAGYLNGEFWGLYNLRERLDRFYFEDHFDADPDALDLLERVGSPIEGDADEWRPLFEFLRSQPMSVEANYRFVESLLDVENFASYQILQIFVANGDWPHGNVRFWKPDEPGARWRWMLYDCDSGFGLLVPVEHDTLTFARAPSDPHPQLTGLVFDRLLESPIFRDAFLNRYADYLNTSFRSDATLALHDELRDEQEALLAQHLDRWDLRSGRWEFSHLQVRTFLEKRPAFARAHVLQHFGLNGTWELGLDVSPPGSGAVRLEGIEIDAGWRGDYWQGVPVRLTAVPAPGYRFSHWSDAQLGATNPAVVASDVDYQVRAEFVPSPERVVIAEINYHSENGFDPDDWIELVNDSAVPVDLSGWEFRDEGHAWPIPAGTSLAPGARLVLCENLQKFRAWFPSVTNAVGDFGFGLSNGGERLELRTSLGALHDFVEYDDAPPWPPEPDGQGPTLELIHPGLDNALPSSWRASSGHGTPGS